MLKEKELFDKLRELLYNQERLWELRIDAFYRDYGSKKEYNEWREAYRAYDNFYKFVSTLYGEKITADFVEKA